jgi:AraC-like DNA-binding protein
MEDQKELVAEIRNLIKALNDPIPKSAKELEHYNIEEIAAILHCSPSSVRNILRENQVKVFQYKGIIRVSQVQIQKFLTKHTL